MLVDQEKVMGDRLELELGWLLLVFLVFQFRLVRQVNKIGPDRL